MNFHKLIFAVALFVAAAACKKTEDTITPSLNGDLDIVGLQEFVVPGQSLTLSPKGVTHPKGKDLLYYWKVTPSAPTACTTEVFTITFTDTLQTCTVMCNVSADGYTGKSLSAFVTVVKGGKDGSIKGIDFPAESISTEDGTYYYKEIGTQTWTLNNMAERSSGRAYRDEDVMSDVLGRYYSYEEAMEVCKSLNGNGMEWVLPTVEDWRTLERHIKEQVALDPDYGKSLTAAILGNATFNGRLMWDYEPAVGDITNASGFAAIPAGYTNMKSSSFEGVYEYASFWTATPGEDSGSAYNAYLICNEPDMYIGSRDKASFGASVRCIRK